MNLTDSRIADAPVSPVSGNPPPVPEPPAGLRSQTELAFWASNEFERLQEQGQSPDLEQWCARFPACRSRIRRFLELATRVDSLLEKGEEGSSRDESLKWPKIGERVFDFTICRLLACGSFARVYLATEASAGDRLVVLKCSLCGEAEARTMGRLAHPHIVPILSARIEKESALSIVCMPFLGSVTLEAVLDLFAMAPHEARSRQTDFLSHAMAFNAEPEDPPPQVEPWPGERTYTDTLVRLAVQLAETLAFLHERGVCHRDLKPSNVLLDASGKALLLDFNLSTSERETDVPVGATLEYAAPEQLRAFLQRRDEGIDQRADLYALGVMLYALLGGVHPCAKALTELKDRPLAHALLAGLPTGFRPFRELCPDMERPVAAILDRCVALDPADRPSAAELAATLRRQFAPARRLRRRIAVHRRAVMSVFALFFVVAAVLGYVWSVTPSFAQREYERGRAAYRAGDFNVAEAHFDAAVRADPRNRPYRFARGCARLQQSKYVPSDKANFEQILDDVLASGQEDSDPQSLALHAYIHARRQKYQVAITICDRIESFGYRPVMVLNNRAYCYMGKREWGKAQTDLDRAVQLDPHCQSVRYNRALVALYCRMTGQLKTILPERLEDMERAVNFGVCTSALYRDAAILYSLAASDSPQHTRFERASFYLHKAITSGESAATFAPFSSLREVLKRPDFLLLTQSQPNQPLPQSELRLLDPISLN